MSTFSCYPRYMFNNIPYKHLSVLLFYNMYTYFHLVIYLYVYWWLIFCILLYYIPIKILHLNIIAGMEQATTPHWTTRTTTTLTQVMGQLYGEDSILISLSNKQPWKSDHQITAVMSLPVKNTGPIFIKWIKFKLGLA